MLLERGADLRKDDIDGCIPSLVAQKYSSIECLNLLDHHTKKRDNILLQQATEVGTREKGQGRERVCVCRSNTYRYSIPLILNSSIQMCINRGIRVGQGRESVYVVNIELFHSK